MLEPKCRLTLASKYYGKGGGGGVPATVVRRNISKEWPAIRKGYGFQQNQYEQYRQREPLLSQLYAQAGEDLSQRGALSPEEEGRVRAATLGTAGQMGMGYSPGTLGTELLNREQYRQQREGIARNFATQTLQTGVGAFGGLTNPMLDYIGKAFTPQVVGGTASGDNKGGSTVSAVGSVIGAALPLVFSDERLKTNIRDTGEKTAEGLPIKDFSYVGDKRRFRGVVAQDVEKVKPEAVMRNPLSGHLMLNLERLPGTPFYELKEE